MTSSTILPLIYGTPGQASTGSTNGTPHIVEENGNYSVNLPANQTQREENIYREFDFTNDGNLETYALTIDASNVAGEVFFVRKTFDSSWGLADEDFEKVPISGNGIKTFVIDSKLSNSRPKEQIGIMITSDTANIPSTININGATLIYSFQLAESANVLQNKFGVSEDNITVNSNNYTISLDASTDGTVREQNVYQEFKFGNGGNKGTYTLLINVSEVKGDVFLVRKNFDASFNIDITNKDQFYTEKITGTGLKALVVDSKLSAERPNEQIGVMIKSAIESKIVIDGAFLTATQ